MPDQLPPSEYGGKVRRNGVQPFPHEPTASEKLSLTYRSGEPSGVLDPDDGSAFNGLLPADRQRKLRADEGALNKGEVWQEFQDRPQPQAEVQ